MFPCFLRLVEADVMSGYCSARAGSGRKRLTVQVAQETCRGSDGRPRPMFQLDGCRLGRHSLRRQRYHQCHRCRWHQQKSSAPWVFPDASEGLVAVPEHCRTSARRSWLHVGINPIPSIPTRQPAQAIQFWQKPATFRSGGDRQTSRPARSRPQRRPARAIHVRCRRRRNDSDHHTNLELADVKGRAVVIHAGGDGDSDHTEHAAPGWRRHAVRLRGLESRTL